MTSITRFSSLTILLASAIWLTGCGPTRVEYRPVLLPVAARPVLTPVKASDLQCLSDSTYTVIVNRERSLRTWGLELEAIIRANNAKAAGH